MSSEEIANKLRHAESISYKGLDGITYFVRYNGFYLEFSIGEDFKSIINKIRCKGTELINFANAIRTDIWE